MQIYKYDINIYIFIYILPIHPPIYLSTKDMVLIPYAGCQVFHQKKDTHTKKTQTSPK